MRTKLGVSVGLLGAAMYFSSFFSGYTVLALLAGYTLLFEENIWLRKTAVKTFVITIAFSLLSAFIGLVPNAINFVDAIATIFKGSFQIVIVSNIVYFLQVTLTIIEKIIMLILGFRALRQATINIGFIDKFVNQHTTTE